MGCAGDAAGSMSRDHQCLDGGRLNWQEASAWRKDGSLVVTVDTMLDGAGYSVEATRTVLLGFDAEGKARIVKSTIKYEAARE